MTTEPVERTYSCPGDSRDIDRAVHLGRLAAFYPACRECVHRSDIQALTPLQIRQWGEVLARPDPGPRFTAEGLESDSVNVMGPHVVRRYCGALGATLCRARERPSQSPAVLVAADGHWTTADLLSAACDALQLAGCRAIEAGAMTSASLAQAACRQEADAALWIGNATGAPHAIALRAWGRAGRPWSSPGGLDPLREAYDAPIDRPRRRGGGLERAGAGGLDLTPIEPLFHALRPLRFVVDTSCEPYVRQLLRLASQATCEVLRGGASPCIARPATADVASSFVDRRLAALGRHVLEARAHFGLWIDGAGASCRLVNEQGMAEHAERLCRLLATYVCREKPGATIVLAPEASGQLAEALGGLGARVARGGATRQSMCAAIESAGAVFACGPGGTFWFAGEPPVPDALMATGLLLTLLSQSDRPASEVLDAA